MGRSWFGGSADDVHEHALGSAPAIPAAKPQGIPTLKMPTARGWAQGQTPVAAPGLEVNAFATGLKHPRWIHVLPDGDVLVAEALTVAGSIRTAFDYAMFSTMKRAAAVGAQPEPHHACCAMPMATAWPKSGRCSSRG